MALYDDSTRVARVERLDMYYIAGHEHQKSADTKSVSKALELRN
jgi:hypothetical protein